MAVAVDPGYVGQLAEVVLRPAINRPALKEYFSIKEGVKGKQTVTFLERAELVTIVDPGCGQGVQPLNLGTTSQTWAPVDMKAWVQECWGGLRGKVYEWGLKSGNDKKDLTDTEYGDYMVDVLEDAIGADLLRNAWFGDPDITSASFPTSVTIGTNTYTAAALVKFFKTFPGAWKRVFQGVSAGTIPRITIAQNATSGDQLFPDAAAFPLFQQIFNAASPNMTAQPLSDWQFMVTRSLFTAYLNYRESQNLDNSFDVQESGVTTLRFRGVPISIVDEWDRRINTFFKPSANGGKRDLPHRAILTVKGNLQLGFDSLPINDAGRPDLEVWTSQDTEMWNARATYVADEQVADTTLIVAAY